VEHVVESMMGPQRIRWSKKSTTQQSEEINCCKKKGADRSGEKIEDCCGVGR
jgi:hypothetical protein